MTTSVASTSSSTTALTVLYQLAQSQAQLTQQTQLGEISQDLQNQLNRQISALQGPTDQISINYSQQQITSLQAQQKTVSALETQFGTNGTIVADMSNQLALMTQAITNSDGASFDNALSALNTDLSDLTPPAYNPLFQYDGIASLKTSGFSIQSSASYNLSTPSGQAAATADVTTASNLVESISKINGSNQTIAASQSTALDGQITALQSLQNQQQTDQQQQVQQETAQLQQNEQNQLHLIQLNLGNTSETATMLNQFANPPAAVTSVFGALQAAVGESASTAETQLGQNPAILSLFA